MSIMNNLTALRSAMKEKNIDAYLIPSADFHQSEYVGEHFKSRAFITGFTGSVGTALVTLESAYLWVDSRYFIQAELELEGSDIILHRIGNPGVPTIPDFLTQILPESATLGFDGRVVSVTDGLQYEKILASKNGSIICDYDLINPIWTDRPELSKEPAFYLEEKYTGASTADKLAFIRQEMSKMNATAHIITSLDDVCWVFNYRGNDVKFSPLVLSYTIIYMDHVELFIDESKLNDEIKANLIANAVTLLPYNDIYNKVKNFSSESTLMIDPIKLNYALYSSLSQDVTRVEIDNPTILKKSTKNATELGNIRNAHIKDGVAVTKYIHWVKTNIGKIPMTELSACAKLEEFRQEQEGYLWQSFAPICAYKEHAAICHYNSTPETNVELKPEGLFLNDTGGNYLEGSTDITRTLALGPITDDERQHFTLVAKSMLSFANTKFLFGTCGFNLDIVARRPFWELGLDYGHGTGHGVGYLLSIHEGPVNFNWRVPSNKKVPLHEGMVLTDEPGIYIAGSHGIRTENELVVRKCLANEYGQFMDFEVITFVPIDLDAIDSSMLNETEKALLNNYHSQVWDKISPYLTREEQAWLKEYTRAI